MDASSTHMNAKRQLLIFLIGSMAFIVSLAVICAAICPTDSSGYQFPAGTDCAFTSHAFMLIGNGQSAFFILLLLGLFLAFNKSIISDGFFLAPFRPPRLHI
jgi:hypothetical protein